MDIKNNIKHKKAPKHEKVLKELMYNLLYEDWMDADDWHAFEDELFKRTRLSYAKLSDQVDIGIKNGINVQTQLSAVCTLLLKNSK